MFNLQTDIKNNHIITRKNKFWLLIFLAVLGMFFITSNSNAIGQTYSITLPQRVTGVEKLEYVVNTVSQGSVDGKTSVSLYESDTLYFLVKIESTGYSQLLAKNVKIVSNKGTTLSLKVFEYDANHNLVARAVTDDELIDPAQTYATSILNVSKDEVFSVQGVTLDKFDTTIKLKNTALTIGEALNVTYSEAGRAAVSATFNTADNSYIIKDITVNDSLQIWISTQAAYSQSQPTYTCSDSSMSQSNNNLTIPAVTSDVSLTVDNVAKNQYNVSFAESTDFSFTYKKYDSQDNYASAPSGGITVTHGDSYSLMCEAIGTATLAGKEVTANGVAVRAVNGVYLLDSISGNLTLAVTGENDSLYAIGLPSSNVGVTITDTSGNALQNPTINRGGTFNFKVSPTAAYTQHIDTALIYAVPANKLVNGDYDTTINPTEASAYLRASSVMGVFTISNVTEPMAIIVKNLVINTYKVTLPQIVTGASYAVTPSSDIQKISDYRYDVVYGKSIAITLTADVGKSIATATLTSDANPPVQISRSGDVYTLQNVTNDTGIVISGIADAVYDVTFEGPGILCTNENGTAFSDNKTSIVHGTGVVNFKIEVTEGHEISANGITVSVTSGNATLTAPSGGVNYYTLSNATGNTVVKITGVATKTFTVSLESYSNTIKFVSTSDGITALPASNIINYGSNFQFKIISTSSENISNITLETNNGSKITSLGNSVYSLPNISQNVTIFALMSSDGSTVTGAPSYWKMAQNVQFVSNPSDACTFHTRNYTPPSSHTYVPATYSLSDELSYTFTQDYNSPYNGSDFTGYKFYYDQDLNCEITNGMYSPDTKYRIYIRKDNPVYDPYENKTTLNIYISVSKTSINNYSEDYFHQYNYSTFGGGIDSDTLSVFGTIYVAAQYAAPNDFQDTTNITFAPPPKGAKYYSVAGHRPDNNPLTDFIYVQEGTELTQLTYTLNKNDEFWFIVRLDDGYEMDSSAVKVQPFDRITMKKVQDVLPTENQYCYKLYGSRTPDVEVYIETTQLKTYNANFSGDGTNFFDEKGDQFLNQTFDYGGSFSFTTEAKEGYVNEGLIFKLTTANGEEMLEVPDSGNTHTSANGGYVLLNAYYDTTTQKIKYTLSDIKGDFSIKATRQRQTFKIYFEASDGIKYVITNSDETQTEITQTQTAEYERNFSFNVVANEGYDISKMVVTANHEVLDFINGKYTIRGITENNTVRVEDVSKINDKITFTQYEGITFKDTNGNVYSSENQVSYGDNVRFKAVLSDAYSNSAITLYAEYSSGTKKEFVKLDTDSTDPNAPYLNTITGVYNITVKENVRIYVEDIALNSYNVKLAKTTGISYYNQYGTEALASPSGSENDDFIIQPVTYGNSLSFKVVADTGYDISNLEVFSKKASVNSARAQMFPSNGVYTLENITEESTITTENIAKSTCTVEFRVVNGGTCIDAYGNNIANMVTVTYGSDYSFKVSLADAYNNSTPTVTIKGTDNIISPNSDKSYTISNITSNKIIEIINITKNSYTATFKAAEGVVYKTAKNKVFTGTQNVEYGDTLYFKVSLLDAYDKSTPWVLLNGEKTLIENGGVYSLENIRDNVEVIVKNVVKNPEEVTMDDVNNVPSEITSEDDVNSVVTATQTYNQLTDTQKSEVLNITKLQNAQQKAGEINHKSGDISITGVGWNIKVAVTNLSSDATQMADFASKVDRRSVLSLYQISLLDILTNTAYEVPYGQKVTVAIPVPDLTGYKNTIVAHENSAGGMEYLDVNITNQTGQFETSSFSLFGVAAKQIPNYVENPSSLAISVSSLVNNTSELQTLLGEGLVSQLGNLIDNSEDNGTSSSGSGTSGTTGSGTSETTPSDTTSSNASENTSSLLTTVSEGVSSGINEAQSNLGKAYEWALDNELWAVIIIMVIGSTLIGIIFLISKKRNKES